MLWLCKKGGNYFWVMLNLVVLLFVNIEENGISKKEIIGYNLVLEYGDMEGEVESLKD